MFSEEKKEQLIRYWKETSKEALETMKGLYGIKRYADCLFFGHLVLEKILKAKTVEKTQDYAPYSHNLLRLAELGKILLSEQETNLLAEVSTFNIEARYPDEKLEFYKKCNKEYTDKYYEEIIKFHQKLCQ